MSLYFIAILPDEETARSVTGFKQVIAERWGPRHAFRSPPHITLIPPFEWPGERITELEHGLTEFSASQSPFNVALSGFDAFPPRVVFMHPLESPALEHLFTGLRNYLAEVLGHQDTRNTRPFHPHMTIAHRDVTPGQFKGIWAYFRNKSFTAHFTVTELALLKLDQHQWQVHGRFCFSG